MGSAAENPQTVAPAAPVAVRNHDSSASEREAKMAADIAELRSIVLAAAKHFNVDLPSDKESPPRPPWPSRTALAKLTHNMGKYDEDATVRHRVLLAPAESMLGASQWESVFGFESPRARVAIGPRDDGFLDTEGTHTLAQWQLNPLVSKCLSEYGYTANGDFCHLNDATPADASADRVVSKGHDHECCAAIC